MTTFLMSHLTDEIISRRGTTITCIVFYSEAQALLTS